MKKEKEIGEKTMGYAFLPDTSVLLNGKLLELLEDGSLLNYQPTERVQAVEGDQLEIVLSRVVLAEIENQANHTKACGSIGIEIIEDLYAMVKKQQIQLRVVGKRPTVEQIKNARGGELDSMIRRDAEESGAILVTGDNIQSTMGLIEGLEVYYLQSSPPTPFTMGDKQIQKIQDFFDEKTMSVHLRAHCVPMVKRGKPGEWNLEKIGDKAMDASEVGEIAERIISEARNDEHSFIERNEPGVSVIQLRNYRIVICRPPFSNAIEITAVRPCVSLTLDDYNLDPKVFKRLDVAEGILVSGSPGAGKSTFISALSKFYLAKNKVVKTLESVRDLVVPPEISQYAPLEGDLEKTADILLLVRPDFTIFDEVRVDRDFKIFGDMRLAGVGMVGVVHASKPVDAIQRFIRRIELGLIPSIIDTVIFIDQGQVGDILSISMTVKKPSGFKDEDLSRPVIEVKDFLTGELLYEIYNFGQDTIVAPVGSPQKKAKGRGDSYGRRGKKGQTADLDDYEEDEDSEPHYRDSTSDDVHNIPLRVFRKSKGVNLSAGRGYANSYMNIYSEEDLLMSATLNKDGDVSIKKNTPMYARVMRAISSNANLHGSME